jgi:mevalonate kinase
MTVSSPELDRLVMVAVKPGALGAMMSGAGRGGNILALVDKDTESAELEALLGAGATSVLSSKIEVS